MNPTNPQDNQGQPVPPQTPTPPQPAATPVAPVAPQPEGMPPAPMGSGATNPMPPTPMQPQGKKKLIVLIASIVAGLALIGVGVWAVLTFLGGNIALTTYEGDKYSILVPEKYEKEELTGSVAFKEPETEEDKERTDGKSTQSSMTISSTSLSTLSSFMSRDEIIKYYDDTFTEENFSKVLADSESSDEKREFKNFTKSDDKFKDFDARRISLDALEDGKHVGSVTVLVVFTEKTIYTVNISAHESDPALQRATDKIIDSLNVKE